MTNRSSDPRSGEFTGKTVDDAVAEGLRRLGLHADDAVIQVVSKGSRGLFGIGSEPAVVRVSPKPVSAPVTPPATTPDPLPPTPATPPLSLIPPQPATIADAPPPPVASDMEIPDGENEQETPAPVRSAASDDEVSELGASLLTTMVHHMGFSASVTPEWRDADAITSERHLLLNLHGDSLSPLIGRRGDTLENIQYLLRLMVNQKLHRWLNIIVDVDNFRAKRVEHLTLLAKRMADQVADTGRAFTLEPMPPNERRIIHLALRDSPHVVTESIGEGERRKVTISPKK